MMDKDEIMMLLDEIPHPAINYSLRKLGILSEIKAEGDMVSAVFAFPFPIEKIPIADKIIGSVAITLENFNLSLEHSIRVMTESEKQNFLELEHEAWKGL
jgi:metal-sulfur cluster biosynthetic enzyme